MVVTVEKCNNRWYSNRLKDISYATRVPFQQFSNYLQLPGFPRKWKLQICWLSGKMANESEEGWAGEKDFDFEWESSEVATVNAVREVVAPGSGKFPATNHPTHSSSLGCSNETYKLLKCSPTTSTIAPQSSRAVPSFVSGVSSQSTKWVLGLGSLKAAFSAKDAQCAEFFCFPSMKLCKKFGTLLEILHSAQCHKREMFAWNNFKCTTCWSSS